MPTLAMQALFDHTQWWPADRLQAFQLRQIQMLIDHAVATVPFYRDRLRDFTGMPPGALTMELFRGLPILKRTDIQTVGADFVARAVPSGHGVMHDIRTSGSTGRPVEIKGTALSGMLYRALGLRTELWHRRDFLGKLVVLKKLKAGETEIRRKGWAPAMLSGPSVSIDMSQPVSVLLDKILEEDPDYLQIHASTLREMLRLSRESGRKPVRLRGIKTESEMVEQDVRDLCADVWGVRVTDVYSCQELSLMAIECFDAPLYHIQSETCLLEVLDGNDRPCGPGETGRVVVTALHNYASPLIRYELGDYATVGEPCPCGRGLPTLSRIAGRLRNLVVLPSGEKVTPVLNWESVLTDLPIRQFQLTQKTVHEIEARIAAKRPFGADDEHTFADYFRRGLGHDFAFKFVYVDEIPRQANGKYEVFRCEVEG